MQEKRKTPRFKTQIILGYKITGQPDSKWDMSRLIDISVQGMLFVAGKKFPASTLLNFSLTFPVTIKSGPILLTGRVLDNSGGPHSFKTRVAFVDLDERSKEKIKKVVDYLSSQTKKGEN